MALSPTPYPPTGPFTSGGAPGIDAGFLNNLEKFFRRSSGDTEGARWFLAAGAHTNNIVGSVYLRTTSMGTAPVSLSVDTSDAAPANSSGTPSTSHLSAYGFQVYEFSTATTNNALCGGVYVVLY